METASARVMRLGLGFAVSQAIRVVAELKISDLLSTGDRAIDDLAAATGSNAGALYRVMRLLSGEGVFREVSAGRFALAEIGRALCSDQPTGPRNFLRMINSEAYLAFGRLSDSVRTGEPVFEAVLGKPRFDWLADHPVEAALFQEAMVSLGSGADDAVAEAYDFGSHAQVVDVGGGHGQLLSAILARHPNVNGILFDREAGIASATSGPGDDAARTQAIAGNFFDSVPVGADVYILKRVIHDWDDERAARILENCRRAMRSHGRFCWRKRSCLLATNQTRSSLSMSSCLRSPEEESGRRRNIANCSRGRVSGLTGSCPRRLRFPFLSPRPFRWRS